MIGRLWVALIALAAGFAAAGVFPELPQRLRSAIGVTTEGGILKPQEVLADHYKRALEELPGTVRLAEEEIKSVGLITTTMLTLLVLPASYALSPARQERRQRKPGRLISSPRHRSLA